MRVKLARPPVVIPYTLYKISSSKSMNNIQLIVFLDFNIYGIMIAIPLSIITILFSVRTTEIIIKARKRLIIKSWGGYGGVPTRRKGSTHRVAVTGIKIIIPGPSFFLSYSLVSYSL